MKPNIRLLVILLAVIVLSILFKGFNVPTLITRESFTDDIESHLKLDNELDKSLIKKCKRGCFGRNSKFGCMKNCVKAQKLKEYQEKKQEKQENFKKLG